MIWTNKENYTVRIMRKFNEQFILRCQNCILLVIFLSVFSLLLLTWIDILRTKQNNINETALNVYKEFWMYNYEPSNSINSSLVNQTVEQNTTQRQSVSYINSDATKLKMSILDRRKRYLVFPESSSFQLIFDLIIGVVDYTSYAILGITCAVAWELPSKPPSEILEEVKHRLNNGTLGLRRNDTIYDTHINEINQNTNHLTNSDKYIYNNIYSRPTDIQYYKQNLLNIQSPERLENPYYNTIKTDAFSQFYTPQKTRPYIADKKNDPVLSTNNPNNYYKWNKYNWWQQNKENMRNQWQKHRQTWKNYNYNSNFPPKKQSFKLEDNFNKLTEYPRHRIYPVYTKRERRNTHHAEFEQTLDILHLHEHLRSRNKLYHKLEGVFHKAGYNGTSCVLRALCETAEKNQLHKKSEPQTFLLEILRAIFTLPNFEKLQKRSIYIQSEEHIRKHYLDAQTSWYDCKQCYFNCSHSLWH